MSRRRIRWILAYPSVPDKVVLRNRCPCMECGELTSMIRWRAYRIHAGVFPWKRKTSIRAIFYFLKRLSRFIDASLNSDETFLRIIYRFLHHTMTSTSSLPNFPVMRIGAISLAPVKKISWELQMSRFPSVIYTVLQQVRESQREMFIQHTVWYGVRMHPLRFGLSEYPRFVINSSKGITR